MPPEVAKYLKDAHELREKKDHSGAIALMERCLTEFPDVSEVQCLWALLQLDIKHYPSAETAINTAIALSPSQSEYYYICGQIHKAQNHTAAAENAFSQCIKLNPQHEKAYFNLGSLYEKQKKYPEAIKMFNKVLELNPKNTKAYYNLGVIYHLQNKLSDAIANYEKGYELAPDDLPLLSNLGAALTMDRQLTKSIFYYERALAISPDYIPAITNLAGTYIELNDMKKAEGLLRRSLSLNPRLPTNWRNLTLCCHYELLNDPDLIKILELIEEDISEEDRMHYDFALGKIYHDCQDYKRAFSYYEKANQLQASKVVFKQEAFANHIQQIIKLDSALPRNRFHFSDDDGPQPLIIVGTSRSGKSLLESLLAQNPEIEAKGEVGIANLSDNISLKDRPEGSYPYWLRSLTQSQATLLRELYLKRLLRDGPNVGKYLTDTMPGNFMYLGLVKSLFPKAKFIYCQRSPLDTCVLLYFKYFIQGHAYSYDMKNLASYYQQHMLLMNYWQSTFSESMMTIEYENLVKEPENQLLSINRFLGLARHFDFNCGAINADEIGIFKHYAKSIAPLVQLLNESVEAPEAVTTSNEALRLKEFMAKAYYHFNLGDYGSAQSLCMTILTEEPHSYRALHLLGVIAFKLNMIEEAIEKLQSALKYSPSNPQLHLDLAACWQKLGKQVEAQEQFKMAEELRTSKSTQPRILDEQMKNLLLSALIEPFDVIDEYERQLLVKGQLAKDNAQEILPSHEQFFTDLSMGNYRDANAWHYFYQAIAFIDHLLKQPKKQLRVLEMGCSFGQFRQFLEHNVRNEDNKQIYYWGLDFREDKLKIALTGQTNTIPSLFTLHDAQFGLPFRNNFFDYLVCFDTIPYLSVEQGRLLLAQMYRVLNENGYLVISTHYQANHPGFMQSVPIPLFEKMLYENGFEIVARRGSQASLHLLMDHIPKEHLPLVNELLKVHPEEMVAAMIAPLFPDYTENVAFLCSVR